MMVYVVIKVVIMLLLEGICIDVCNMFIKVICIYFGFICSEINDKVEKVLFIVDIEMGCKVMVRVINKEKVNSYVLIWLWVWLYWILCIVL